MGDPIQAIEIDGFPSHTTSAAVNSLPRFPVILKNLISSPAFLLILSLTISTINLLIYPSILFEWLAFFLLVSCISVFSALFVTPLIFFIERFHITKNIKVFYFVFALKTSLRYFFYSASILFSWYVLIKPDMTSFVRRLVTKTLATSVIAAVMWMLKIVIFKELDCRFHDKDFFPNIEYFISNEYVLQTLLGSWVGSQDPNDNTLRAQLKHVKRAFEFMLLFVCTKLRTICDEVENTSPEHVHKVEDNISLVFKNLANKEHSYVQETDLLSRMKKEDVAKILRLFDGAEETRRISQESLRNWMIKVYNKRRDLVQLLNRSSEVIEQLNIHALVIQSILVTLIWCLLMGVGTTKSLAYLSAPLLLFGYYCKIIFDGAMLAIVMHPFHKGDHCIIDEDKLVVKEIGLIKTEFWKENRTKLELLNSVLLTKSVSNFNRSSELTETFEILASSSISCNQISAINLKIDELIGSNPENWRAKRSFNFTRKEEGKDAYNLEITNVRKFENYKVKEEQRYEFVLKLKKILEDMEIMCWTIK